MAVVPVEVVHLNLAEVPVVLVVVLHEPVVGALVAVIGESEIAYAALATLFDEEVDHAVVDEACLERVEAALSHAVQQVVVDDIDAELHERPLIHGLRALCRPVVASEVRQLGGHHPLLARIAAQGYACGFLASSAVIDGCRVEIVDSAGDGIVDHAVDLVLVDAALTRGQAHHAEAEDGHLVARMAIAPIGHLGSLSPTLP